MGADAKTTMKVEMTDAAAKRIARIVASDPGKTALRVSVEGGGCSGFSYRFDLVEARNDDDVAIEKDGSRWAALDISGLSAVEVDTPEDLAVANARLVDEGGPAR